MERLRSRETKQKLIIPLREEKGLSPKLEPLCSLAAIFSKPKLGMQNTSAWNRIFKMKTKGCCGPRRCFQNVPSHWSFCLPEAHFRRESPSTQSWAPPTVIKGASASISIQGEPLVKRKATGTTGKSLKNKMT